MKIIINDFSDDNTSLVYPCLLQHIPDAHHFDPNKFDDIILATRSNGDFIDGIVLTTQSQLSGFTVGSLVEAYMLKKHYRPYYGEVVLSNG